MLVYAALPFYTGYRGRVTDFALDYEVTRAKRLAVFHRPHPRTVTDKGAVKSVRRFLTESGIEP